MKYAIKLDSSGKVDLGDIDPEDTGKATKEECAKELEALGVELCNLQEWLYAAKQHSVLVVLQGLDTSGKDGTIEHVMASVNPQGCEVAAFKVPTEEEAAHDFLWRAHQKTPGRGMITIFNRSHYEDVLVTRVHKLIEKPVWEARYQQINHFEELLASDSTLILKFFLHISSDEQKERLLAREQDESKAWKLSVGDWQERKLWDDYTRAYEDALAATSTKTAPWYIIRANHKWFRNLAIAKTIVDTLNPYKDDWQRTLKKMGEERKAELTQMREGGGSKANGRSNAEAS